VNAHRPVVAVVVSFVGACSLFTNLDGLGSGDSSVPIDAAGDQASDAPTTADGGTTIVSVGVVPDETGNVQQTHVVWAAQSQRWVLFYIRDTLPTQVLTMFSPDFASWTPGQTLSLPHTIASVGRELSVAYRAIGGHDVVHVAMSHEIASNERRHTHARGVVQGDTISFTTPEEVSLAGNNITGVDPDAPATIVTTNGTVYDATGFVAYGDAGSYYNANLFVAKNPDDGTSATFTSGGWTKIDLELTKRHVNSRAFVEVQGIIAAFWDSADVKPSPTDVHGAVDFGTWSAPSSLFADAGGGGMNENEWSVTAVNTQAHAVRMTTAGVFQHLLGSPALGPGGTVPAIAASPTGGVLLLSNGSAPTLYVLATDNSIQATTYQASAWSSWTVVVPATTAGRAYLSGYSDNASHRALVWTQVGPGGYEIDGVALP
jgi:hypothetical protein